jgi:hypothetical protein
MGDQVRNGYGLGYMGSIIAILKFFRHHCVQFDTRPSVGSSGPVSGTMRLELEAVSSSTYSVEV